MDKEFAIKFLRVRVFTVVFLIIIIHVLSTFGLFVFHGIREEAFGCFFLVSVKLWNKTILLWLWLHVFARFSEDGLLPLNWNDGAFWCFLGIPWLSGLLGFGDWQRSLKEQGLGDARGGLLRHLAGESFIYCSDSEIFEKKEYGNWFDGFLAGK